MIKNFSKTSNKINTSTSFFSNKIILAGILLLTFFVYSNSINNDFSSWDDDEYVINNPLIKDLSLQGTKAIFTTPYMGNYHPLTCLTNALEFKFFGLNPKVFHFTNLFFHLLNVVLVFYFVLNLTGFKNLSGFCALFFAIHPLHTESVSWIAERKDVLYSFFYLLSLIFYCSKFKVQSPKLENEKPQLPIINYQLSILFFIFSLLSKSMAVTLPVILILIEYYKINLQFTIYNLQFLKKHIPFLMLAAIFGIIAIYSQSSAKAMDMSPDFSFLDRIFIACYGIIFYVFKLLIPVNLSALHSFPQKINGLLPLEYYFSVIVILTLIFLFIKYKIKNKEIIFGILFFLITISPVLQIIPVGRAVVAERYTYIPYLGLFFAITQISNFIPIFSGSNLKNILTAVFVGYVATFSIITYQRNKIWRNGMSLFSDVVEKNPENYYGYFGRGTVNEKLKKYDEAVVNYSEAIKRNPKFEQAFYNRANSKSALGNYKSAIDDLTEALAIKPDYAKAYINRGVIKQQLHDYDGAINDHTKAIEINGELTAVAYFNRGNVKGETKDYSGAMNDFSEAIRINNDYKEAYFFRGLTAYYLTRNEEACKDWNMALSLGYTNAYGMLKQNCK